MDRETGQRKIEKSRQVKMRCDTKWLNRSYVHSHIRIIERSLVNRILGVECERDIEYRYATEQINRFTKVLEIGSSDSILALKFAKMGCETHALDIRPYTERHPNLRIHVADACNTRLPSNYFDSTIAISVIEHIGIGHYGDPQHKNGDLQAIREMFRVTRPGGRIIITTPYYRIFKTLPNFERWIDAEYLEALLKDIQDQILDMQFIKANRKFLGYYVDWTKISRQEADSGDYMYHATLLLTLKKKCQ